MLKRRIVQNLAKLLDKEERVCMEVSDSFSGPVWIIEIPDSGPEKSA